MILRWRAKVRKFGTSYCVTVPMAYVNNKHMLKDVEYSFYAEVPE